jgi:hypothetical protein
MKRRKFIQSMAAGAAVPISALGDDQEVPYAVDPGHAEVMPVLQLIGDLGEPVKAMTVFRDSVIIVTEYGKVYRITMEDLVIHKIGWTGAGPPIKWPEFMEPSDRRF